MKLQRFLEYTNNTEYTAIKFNPNELKYLQSKSDILAITNTEYIVNCRKVSKISTGEYLVIGDKVKCSTIQSLLKYTIESVEAPIEWVKTLFDNATKVKLKYGYIKWLYDGKEFAKQRTDEKIFAIQQNILKEGGEKFKLVYWEILYVFKYVIYNHLKLRDYLI